MTDTYIDLLKIPSVSTNPDHAQDMQRTAEFLADYLRKIGVEHVEIFQTALHPILYAEKKSSKPDAKTLLIYGHYDVQPEDPIDEWQSDPFEPTFRGDYLYARGASDMKGQVMVSIFALESALASGDLPINVKFILEGEEEIGSPPHWNPSSRSTKNSLPVT